MRKPRWTAIAVAILAATLALITLFRAKEPTYKGRALSNWVISGYQNPGPEAETAIGEIGTNGIPFLLEWIQYEPAPWRAKLAATVVRIAPSAANSRLTGAITARNRLTRAAGSEPALIALGPPAYTANQLKEILTASGSSRSARRAAAEVLENIQPDTEITLPIFLSALTNANSDTRRCAAWAINHFSFRHPKSPARSTIIPLLIHCLKDSEPEVVKTSITSLVALRVDPSEVLPLLTNLLSHPSPIVSTMAETSIERLVRARKVRAQ